MARQAKGAGADKRTPATATETEESGTPPAPVTNGSLSSFDIFCMCIDRAKNMVKIHAAAHGKGGKPEKYMSDAHRAAVVLSVSALDAFVRTFVISRTRNLLADRTRALPAPLCDHIMRFVRDKDLLEAARNDDLLDRVEKAFRSDFEKRSFQGCKVIAEYMQLVGFEDVLHEVAVNAGVNEDTLREELDEYTERRHTIAHRGDYDLSVNPPEENTITKTYAQNCIKLVTLIAKHINELEI